MSCEECRQNDIDSKRTGDLGGANVLYFSRHLYPVRAQLVQKLVQNKSSKRTLANAADSAPAGNFLFKLTQGNQLQGGPSQKFGHQC